MMWRLKFFWNVLLVLFQVIRQREDRLWLRYRAHGNNSRWKLDGRKYEIPPDILANKEKYEFLKWDCELGDCVIFDMRTLHGTLSSSIPQKTLSRYTLRVAKEDTKINYVGDWTSYNYRKAMQDAGYKNGDNLGGTMFPQLWPK